MSNHLISLATASFLACLGVSTCPAQAASNDMIGHWPFDEKDGQTARDLSAQKRDAVVHGAQWCEGKIGGALRFDGLDDYVALGDLGEHQAVTIAFWVRPEAQPKPPQWQGLVTSDAWEKGVFHIPIEKGCVEVYLHLGDKARARLSSSPLDPNVWQHVTITADTKTRTMRLYLNGFLEDDTSLPPDLGTLKLIKHVVGRECGERQFKGAIDDVRIYARALTEEEIRRICPDGPRPGYRDPRNLRAGWTIPDESYCDQPRVVVARNGDWVCILTTGAGHEGQGGQHVVATISNDQGKSWSPLIDVEPSDGPEASYAVTMITPAGRIYAFYTYNGDRVNTLNGKKVRSDTQGWYCYRFSDDHGRTWSQRHRIPVRVTAADRGNDWQGKVQMFWAIGKPYPFDGSVIWAFTKLAKYFLVNGEGWFVRSDNLLTEKDPDKIDWQLLPDGDQGLRNEPFGSVQEEFNIVPLTGDDIYCMYRTTTGHPCHAYSRDGGHTWTKPEFATYTPGGRKLKTPRACPKVWKTSNGNYLFWYHNNGGKAFDGRNPAWITGGIEKDGLLHWRQPEILLYDPNPNVRISYPDLIEQDGKYWIAETQKTVARVHEIDPTLLEGLWTQGQLRTVAQKGLALSLTGDELKAKTVALPKLAPLTSCIGFAVELGLTFDDLSPGQIVLDGRSNDGKGIVVQTGENATLRIDVADAATRGGWDSDPGLLAPGKRRHVVFIVDGGPKIITVLVDGVLCDGGEHREYGWGRFPRSLGDVTGSGILKLAPALKGKLSLLRIYDRRLRTSEAVGNYHAWRN
ncbi:MAG: exo-alpha-sialidase [Phycisphaerae bacterium]|nr:exo-alpha-sialidase [Phycisphaerae bacterium]